MLMASPLLKLVVREDSGGDCGDDDQIKVRFTSETVN